MRAAKGSKIGELVVAARGYGSDMMGMQPFSVGTPPAYFIDKCVATLIAKAQEKLPPPTT